MSDIFKVLQRTTSGLNSLGEFAPAIVGSVAEGAIIERGSNVNGEYVKFADGTLICYARKSIQLNTWESVGSLYIATTEEQTFPHIFTNTNYVMTGWSKWSNSYGFGMGFQKRSTSGYVCFPVESRNLNWSSAPTAIEVFAKGRWK